MFSVFRMYQLKYFNNLIECLKIFQIEIGEIKVKYEKSLRLHC